MAHRRPRTSSAREPEQREERDGTQEVFLANNHRTGGGEGFNRPHRGRVPQTRRQKTELSSKDRGGQKIDEKRTKSFHEARRTRTHESSQQAETREK